MRGAREKLVLSRVPSRRAGYTRERQAETHKGYKGPAMQSRPCQFQTTYFPKRESAQETGVRVPFETKPHQSFTKPNQVLG